MKKALALVLALVLALSMAVSAFALDVVTLKPAPETTATLINISDPKYQLGQDEDYGTKYLVGPEGGKFYVTLDGSKEYKNIKVTANGIVTAKVVDYDPETMTGAETEYFVEDKDGNVMSINDVVEGSKKDKFLAKYETLVSYDLDVAPYDIAGVDADKVAEYLAENDIESYEDLKAEDWKKITGQTVRRVDGVTPNYEILDEDATSYAFNKDLAKLLNDQHKSGRYVVSNENLDYVYVIELVVEENYSAAYKTGSVKVTADEVVDTDKYGRDVTEAVSGTISIVSDVAIFEYEMVNWAGKTENALLVNVDEGYSDYLTALKGYGAEYDEDALRYDEATVVSTTAFRALRENEYSLNVEAGKMFVEIEEIAASQRGVNFAFEDVIAVYNLEWPYNFLHVQFGFYGDQVIASDFSITVDLGIDAYELRELFGEKVEEEDIITYYVLKDGEAFDSFTVDYMTDDVDEDLLIEIEGKAGDTLGMYTILLEVPAEETETEENPNTGAESVVGVVAALAVVSVATAAAVSLKK